MTSGAAQARRLSLTEDLLAPRVELRPLSTDDAAHILAWRTSGRVRAFTASGPLVFPDDGADEAGGADGRTLCWIVEVDGVPGGLASLLEIDRLHARAALAHCLAEPELEGFGIHALVEYWLMEYAVEGMGLERVTCEAAADDVTARRMHEAFGFTEESRLRGHRESGDRRLDVVGLGLLAADWRASRPAVARRLRLRGFDPPHIR